MRISENKSFLKQLKAKEISHERMGRIMAGFSVAATVIPAFLVHPFFLIGLVGIGVNLIQSGITNECLIKDILIKMGFPGEADLAENKQADISKLNKVQKDLTLSVI